MMPYRTFFTASATVEYYPDTTSPLVAVEAFGCDDWRLEAAMQPVPLPPPRPRGWLWCGKLGYAL